MSAETILPVFESGSTERKPPQIRAVVPVALSAVTDPSATSAHNAEERRRYASGKVGAGRRAQPEEERRDALPLGDVAFPLRRHEK